MRKLRTSYDRTPDTSSSEIRRLREAYCAEFLRTGTFNPEMATALRAYVKSQQPTKVDLRKGKR